MVELSEGALADAATVRAIAKFVVAHGGFATAVVEHVGRRGARVVLLGADGRWGDQCVASVAHGRANCKAAGVDVVEAWSGELAAQMRR